MKDEGIDITIKNSPDHILAPSDWDMVIKVKFGKISSKEYRTWYLNLMRERWQTRKDEFIKLAQEGLQKDIKLLCYCSKTSTYCHAKIAAEFLNAIIARLK